MTLSNDAAGGYALLKEIVEQYLHKSDYADISLTDLFARLPNKMKRIHDEQLEAFTL